MPILWPSGRSRHWLIALAGPEPGSSSVMALTEPGPSPDLAEALVAIQRAAEREVSLRIRLVDQLAGAERRELEVQMAGLERELAEARAAAVAIATAPKPWWRFWGS